MKRLAFVLSGGGSRGAMQVGALRALLEAGYQPNLVVGTSIGAANAAFLGVHGYNPQGIERLARVWKTTIDQDLLPTNLWWQTMRSMFRRKVGFSNQRVREFAVQNGLAPELRFKDILSVDLFVVAADLKGECQVIFGLDPEDSLLEGVLASMALPPWISPVDWNGRYLMDGAAVSNLPIEAAMRQGATEIIALDLLIPNEVSLSARGLGPFFNRLNNTIESRQIQLEMELAEARGIPVRRVSLVSNPPVPIWDFRQSIELMEQGYQITRQSIQTWPRELPSGWREHLHWLPGFENKVPKK